MFLHFPILAAYMLVGTGSEVFFVQTEKPTDASKAKLPKGLELLKEEAGDTALRKLQKARYNEALAVLGSDMGTVDRGWLFSMLSYGAKAEDALAAIVKDSSERRAVLAGLVERMRTIEKLAEKRADDGDLRMVDLCVYRYFRMDAEIRLARTAGTALPNSIQDKSPEPLDALELTASDTPLRMLLKARYNEALSVISSYQAMYDRNEFNADELPAILDFHRRAAEAYIAINGKTADQIAVLTALLERMKKIETEMQKRFNAGALRKQSFELTRDYRLDAETRLIRAKEPGKAIIPTIIMEKPAWNPSEAAKIEPLKDDSHDSEMGKLLKARFNEALAAFKINCLANEVMSWGFNLYTFNSYDRIVLAIEAIPLQPADQYALFTSIHKSMKELERMMQRRYGVGSVSKQELHIAQYCRIDAEIRLAESEAAMKK